MAPATQRYHVPALSKSAPSSSYVSIFQQEVRKLSPLFVGDERILSGLERLAEELRSGRNLRSLPGSG